MDNIIYISDVSVDFHDNSSFSTLIVQNNVHRQIRLTCNQNCRDDTIGFQERRSKICLRFDHHQIWFD